MLHTLQRTLISNFIYFTSIANRIFNSVLDFEIRFTKGILHTMLKAVSKDQTHDEVINQTFKLHTDKSILLYFQFNS
ncbi:unnamed protein product [Cuscuta campestris]|uniref:Uncharacterized protein n=1 Tax=Cuscuta campestris TaxID=132261 RepID=A0A484M9Q9_9ASTE|nr:unnamed protein product [Cuscuta campestris]